MRAFVCAWAAHFLTHRPVGYFRFPLRPKPQWQFDRDGLLIVLDMVGVERLWEAAGIEEAATDALKVYSTRHRAEGGVGAGAGAGGGR